MLGHSQAYGAVPTDLVSKDILIDLDVPVAGPAFLNPNIPVPVHLKVHSRDAQNPISSVQLMAVGASLPGIARFAPKAPSAFVDLLWDIRFEREHPLGVEVTLMDQTRHFRQFDLLPSRSV
jgi:hypothetical protein